MANYKIVAHPQTKVRFAELPDGCLVPNQGNMPADAHSWTDEDIEANFRHYMQRRGYR